MDDLFLSYELFEETDQMNNPKIVLTTGQPMDRDIEREYDAL